MRIAIIGADGQLGSDLCRVIPKEEQVPLTINDVDITSKEATSAVIGKIASSIVINTAACHNVDACEDNAGPAFAVNTFGVRNLALACQGVGAALVHISTDYVFDGEKKSPYTEEDIPRPLSIYGISKLAGEYCIRYILGKYFIVRTTGLYGAAGCLGKGGGNFVENIIKQANTKTELKVVNDEVLSPTYAFDLAKQIYQLVKTHYYGLYHIVNHGQCSWYEFTRKIFQLLERDVKVQPINSSAFPAKARRPKYSALGNANLNKMKLDNMPAWEDALKAYLIAKGHLKV
ncbi:MAG: dTDP-4-dehydrorhamnose reductase [Candidatus Margulisbacteria bacterium]|nr:dTDP-4-dehydrorhamnose reductase [Candidatus Margulisiibacteriota bacterium]